MADLTQAEQSLCEAFPGGRAVGALGAGAALGLVRAEVIARLLLGEYAVEPGHVPAVRLRGAVVSGLLDLSHCDVPHALVMLDCEFEQPPRLTASALRLLDLSGSRLPGLLGEDLQVEGALRLVGCRFDGPIRLSRAQVGGTLDLSGSSVRGNPAIHVDSLRVERDLICRDAEIDGEVLLWSSRIDGTLVAEGARICNEVGASLNGDGLVVGGGLFFGTGLSGRALVSRGELRLQDARIARCCILTGARLDNHTGAALNAERLHVEGPLALNDGFSADGTVLLPGAVVRGPLTLAGATLKGTFDATLAEVAATPDFVADGPILLEGARIGGSADLSGARLHNEAGETLSARRVNVTGRIHCDGLSSEGEIVLSDGTVGASVEFHGARLTNPAGRTLTAWGLTVGGVIDLCDGFASHGRVSLTSSRIRSAVCLAGSTIDGRLSLRSVEAAALRTDPHTDLRGTVDLRYARFEVLRDLPDRWPDRLLLDGLTYTSLEAPLPVEARLTWLGKETSGYLPQPYEHLAATYHRHGHDTAARVVLLAKYRRRRTTQALVPRAWGHLQDVTVGYGYRPIRAVAWLLVLLLVATAAFTAHHPPAAKPAEAPPFTPFLYALDLLVPVVSFGQEGAFNPHGWQQWLAAALTAAGWLLATTVATGITRTLSRT